MLTTKSEISIRYSTRYGSHKGVLVMSFLLLQKVRVLSSAEEYEDYHGQSGVVVRLEQMQEDLLPSIDVRLHMGDILENLFPCDIEKIP